MMHTRMPSVALTTVALIGLAGCSTIKADFSTKPIGDVRIDSVETVVNSIRDKMYSQTQESFNACSRGAAIGSAALPEEPTCRAMRNAVLASLVGASDDACNEHLKSIYGNEAGWNIGLGTLAALFGGTAAVVGANAAKSNYAAAGTFFGGERSLSNEVVYKNQLVPAIHYKIIEKRQEKRGALFARFGANATDYPLRAAVADAIQYHYSCSFMEGMQWALREGTTNSDDAKLARARGNLQTASVELNRARMDVAGRTSDPAAKLADNLAADPVYKAAMARHDALSELVKQLEVGLAAPAPAPSGSK